MTTAMQIQAPDPSFAAPFRFRQVAGKYVLTNYGGQYAFLEPEEFRAYVEGTLDRDSPIYSVLRERNFIKGEMNVDQLVEQIRERKGFLSYGPHLHIIEVTLRCNQTCVYCHSSRAGMEETDKDMSPETAERVVDLIFQSNSPSVTIEFQGGEPLVNFPVVQHIVEYALKKNEEAQKNLEFSLVTNLAAMDEEKLAFLMQHKIQVCTSIDGPAELHNKQRRMASGNAYEEAEKWIRKINAAYAEQGLEQDVYHVEGLLTTTREALSMPKEIVDTYAELGFTALFLRPVDPFGFANKTGDKVGYSPSEFLEFYRKAVDYIIAQNLAGVRILERHAALFLTKILVGEDPNFLDLRNPCGAGIGQLAYSCEGQVYTCDEARMLHGMGDDFFQLAEAPDVPMVELMGHETVKALAIASNLDSSPDCANCVYNPYCGICPVHNYATQGSIHGQIRAGEWCAIRMGIQDYLFEKLEQNDPQVMEVFNRWVTFRPRDHYLHVGGTPG